MATHTPAWKRLGLKLKYAKELPDRPSTAISAKAHDHDPEASERPAKRRRVAKNDSTRSLEHNSAQSSSDNLTRIRELKNVKAPNGAPPPSEALPTTSQQPIQRKKSVTFSEETKQEDGDTRTTIDFPVGSPGSTPRKPKKPSKHSPENESPDTLTTGAKNDAASSVNSDNTTPTKQASRVKKGKKSKSPQASSKDKSSSALDYLDQHRLNRESWKFNKILDVWILSHALDNEAVPSTHVPALAGYVRGLPAKAGSRERLVKECKEALSSSQLDGDAVDTDRTLFIELIDSQKGPLEDTARLEDFLLSHFRAVVLLWALNEDITGQTNGSAILQSPGQQGTTLTKRSKKSRTSAPIDISSSSESDSDSDSSDNSSDPEEEAIPKGGSIATKATNVSASRDETSSSGTSSSEDEGSTSSSSDASSRDSNSDSETE